MYYHWLKVFLLLTIYLSYTMHLDITLLVPDYFKVLLFHHMIIECGSILGTQSYCPIYLFLHQITSKLITLMTESLLRFSLICVCVRACMCTHIYACESRCLQSSEEAVTSSGPEVTGNCGVPNVGSGYWTLVFYKSSMCSRAPSHLSVPMAVCMYTWYCNLSSHMW